MSQPGRSPKAAGLPRSAVSRRVLPAFLAGLFALTLAGSSLAAAAPVAVIDAGHGGIDRMLEKARR